GSVLLESVAGRPVLRLAVGSRRSRVGSERRHAPSSPPYSARSRNFASAHRAPATAAATASSFAAAAATPRPNAIAHLPHPGWYPRAGAVNRARVVTAFVVPVALVAGAKCWGAVMIGGNDGIDQIGPAKQR